LGTQNPQPQGSPAFLETVDAFEQELQKQAQANNGLVPIEYYTLYDFLDSISNTEFYLYGHPASAMSGGYGTLNVDGALVDYEFLHNTAPSEQLSGPVALVGSLQLDALGPREKRLGFSLSPCGLANTEFPQERELKPLANSSVKGYMNWFENYFALNNHALALSPGTINRFLRVLYAPEFKLTGIVGKNYYNNSYQMEIYDGKILYSYSNQREYYHAWFADDLNSTEQALLTEGKYIELKGRINGSPSSIGSDWSSFTLWECRPLSVASEAKQL
jgi:hypothetical protein